MATLQQINGIYHLRFRFGGKPFRRSLGTTNTDEAETIKKDVEVNISRINSGVIPPPPEDSDVIQYVLSGGKNVAKPKIVEPTSPTLEEMWKGYLVSLPAGSKEENSLATETTHFSHLCRILKPTIRVTDLSTDDLQRYIRVRSKEKGQRGLVKARTIGKEISSFRNVWNNFALFRKIVAKDFRATFGKLNYPKESERPPFQTWEQIERQVERGGLSQIEIANLWDCLFLDIGRIREFLEFVRTKPGLPGWIYPALVAVAHTGCRKGEVLRSLHNDWDIGESSKMPMVRWREKKKDRSKDFTLRQVSVTPFLQKVMNDWFASHPGGRYVFCGSDGQALSVDEAARWFNTVVADSKWTVLRGWHVFRHSFVSCLAKKSVDQRVIDASVGHQTDEMRKRYRHLFPQRQHELLAAVFSEGE